MTRAVFLGRFQPFHEGHHQVVEEHQERFDDFAIAVGSAGKQRTGDNPLGFEERREVIRSCHQDTEVIAIEDETKDEEGNRRWAEKIEEESDADVVLSQNELVKRLVREYTDMEVVEQELFNPDVYSGTEIRRRIRSGEEWRYLVPDCAVEEVEKLVDVIEKSGRDYDFKPGWKKENAFHGTSND